MTKQDLTKYSDSELSLMVFNDEMLYKCEIGAILSKHCAKYSFFRVSTKRIEPRPKER